MFSRLITAIAAFTIISHALHAQPVVADDPDFGVGSITGDPSQDLAFLDLTVTQGIPYATMQTELMPGGAYEGWRRATLNEVVAFVNSFGWSPPITDPFDENAIGTTTAFTILHEFIGIHEFGTFGEPISTGYINSELAAGITFAGVPDLSSNFFLAGNGFFNPISASAGHWLVREIAPNAPVYQGTLSESGQPFDGDSDFRVTLLSGFGLALETIEHAQVPVTDGLFTIPLSFNPTLFESTGATLRIEVRAPSGTGDYETITPDQPISPGPIAVFAQRAAIADSANVASSLSNQEARPLALFFGTEPYGVGYMPPTATRVGNTVTLNGLVRDVGIANTPGNSFARLDEDMRPNARLLFLQASSAGVYRIDILPDGMLQFQGAPGVGGPIDWVSLDGISFAID